MSGPLFGEGMRRKGDPRFLTGRGRYVGDLVFPEMLHAAFLRSAHACAPWAAWMPPATSRAAAAAAGSPTGPLHGGGSVARDAKRRRDDGDRR